MFYDNKVYFGKSGEEKVYIYPKMANRHGMIAGATGTGKTVTLKVLAESFSDMGVPVFMADIKGDLAGTCKAGVSSDNMNERIVRFGLAETGFDYKAYPVTFWDIYQEKGIPLRTTVSEMGPLLLGRMLGLNDTQSDILTVCFKIADDQNLLLEDTKDLKALLNYVGENAADLALQYGNINKTSLAVIVRSIVALESEGGEKFCAERALDMHDWMKVNDSGRGLIQVLDCQTLVNKPTMYSTFMLWLLTELFETLPEAGDLDKPKMVFFFDEAHLLFSTASKSLLEKIEQVVKLIRSKGVGVYFITQSPKDIPDGVLAQLGNKIQHALHAYTPSEQKAAKAVADSFRANPEINTFDTLINLGIGEALVSVLDEKGVPTVVQKVNILPPQSFMGAIDDMERSSVINNSMYTMKYEETIDNDSAYEFLMRKRLADEEELERMKREEEERKLAQKQEEAERKAAEREEAAALKQAQREEAAAAKAAEKEALARAKEAQKASEAGSKAVKRATKSVASTAAGTIGREIGNTLGSSIGGSFGKKLAGNVGGSLGRNLMGLFFKG
ncbi:MAG: DUF853 family protein [Lachnospiraceae bacterium]|nr:DUF853 family protein [Candidatus Merdinaster equi]